ncbi:hypothetical protein LTR10_016986 [Elasticomyces elasticus]|uniref:Uncharacterized protein n=1 Tax=Exophiala sideris TaxID=1016849 RepID=A0ABR0JFA6_9EURO|nr:hypothetical protein LTR10_016986 [Elasticomyces elasticus]KAK5025240.1 hypothetical protein LTS07_008091 [Exophiala sideris]KAK5029212.1 hypothetical protein LTR13_008749 [Exophiala sideris]KAK5063299.1 hypothetical protein LTR69_004005 [Exophiala sideris]KAK5179015.1 hypothetical protein LTR44_008504 [Eurotiomycetes sp. CCFEE 6388]
MAPKKRAKRFNDQDAFSPPSTPSKRKATSAPDVDNPVLHLALDTGQQYLKAAYLFLYSDPPRTRHLQSASLIKHRSIAFDNHATRMPSRVLYLLDDMSIPPKLRPLYGRDLQDAIQKNRRLEDDVIEFFKPLIFGENMGERGRTFDQVAKLSQRFRELQQATGALSAQQEFGPFDLLVDLLKYLYRTTIMFISRDAGSPDLGLPRNLEEFGKWNAGNLRICVALPVPAGTTTAKSRLYRSAAEAAGIPNPYPVSEAAAALAFHVATNEKPSLQKILGIVDIGASTADVEVDKVISSSPLELVQVVKSATAWCGGRILNTACRTHVLEKWENYKGPIIQMLNDYRPDAWTWERLGMAIEAEFEVLKKDFDGSQDKYLHIPGLPKIPEVGLIDRGILELDAGQLRIIHDSQLQRLFEFLDPIVDEFGPGGLKKGRIHELILAGGASNSPYIRYQLIARYEGRGLQVKTSTNELLLDTTVAQGALLLLGENNIIKSRIIRDGYFVVQHEEPSQGREYPREAFHVSRHDNRGRVCVTKFLLRPNESVSTQHHESTVRGERILLFQEKDDDDMGWTVKEDFYRTSSIEDDGVWIDKPGLSFDELSPLAFKINEHDTRGFKRSRARDKTDWYYHIEYEVKLILEGELMTFEFIVPKSGKFPSPNDCGFDVIVQQGTYNCTGDFELFPGERRPWT